MDAEIEKQNLEDEAALDKELQDSINAVKAGETLKAEQPTGETGAAGPIGETGETGTTGEADGGSQETGATGEGDFRIPNKGKFESDESYEKRLELFDLVKARKAATTPEAKARLSEQINKTKGDLRNLGSTEKTPFNNSTGETGATGEEDPALKADRDRLRELGGLTKEDIDAYLQQQHSAIETKSTLDKFVDRTAELKDPDVREVFFDFVDANYVWQGKTGKELMTVLELAREAMFKPSETIQERVLRGAGVQEKVNAMQFPGGTGAKVDFSPEMRKSIDELKATGMSEEKAVELLSD